MARAGPLGTPLGQGASRAAPGKSGLHARGEGVKGLVRVGDFLGVWEITLKVEGEL